MSSPSCPQGLVASFTTLAVTPSSGESPLPQDIDGAWTHLPQAVHFGNLIVGDCPGPVVHVDGDDFPVVVDFNITTNVPLVYISLPRRTVYSRGRRGLATIPSPSVCVGLSVSLIGCSFWDLLLQMNCHNLSLTPRGKNTRPGTMTEATAKRAGKKLLPL